MGDSKLCSIFSLLFFAACFGELFADTPCADWEPFRDEKCFKVLDTTLRTFDEAEKSCAKLENDPTLVIIRSKEEQDFVANYLFKTHKNVENFWIGAKFGSNSSKFHWIDNADVSGYTNWDSRGPRNKANYCVEMLADEASVGKWFDESCEKKNLVVCQKMQTWSISRLQKTLLDARKELRDSQDEANRKITELNLDLNVAKKNISDIKQTLVPVGFIYAQLPNEKSPSEIWPWMTWSDVSSTYAGIFFRVTGGDAAAIGHVQGDNAPYFSEINSFFTSEVYPSDFQTYLSNFAIPKGGWSPWIRTGNSDGYSRFVKFYTSGGEVRPRNMAMRVWKRTA